MENKLCNNEQRIQLQCINPNAKTLIKLAEEDDAQFVVIDEFGNITQPKEDFTKVQLKLSATVNPDAFGNFFEWTILKAYLVYPAENLDLTDDDLTTEVEEKKMEQDIDSEPPSYNECCGIGQSEYMLPPYSQTNDDDDDDDDISANEFMPPQPPDGCFIRKRILSSSMDATDVLTKLYIGDVPSVVDDANPAETLSKILALPDFDPFEPQPHHNLHFKKVITLQQLSLRQENNEIDVEIDKCHLNECEALLENGNISLGRHFKNIFVNHSSNEFVTICQCVNCLNYREVFQKKISTHLNESKMLLAFLKVFTDFYGSMLKTSIAYNTFQNIVNQNKNVYWLTTGLIYSSNASYLNCFKTLTDNMMMVLFSSILMVTNPWLLLQILSCRVEAIVKAYAEGFFESLDNPDRQGELEAEIMLDYIVHGYEEICRISEQVGSLLFAFEKNFLQKFMVTWQLLCKRLYQQHVYLKLTDEMLTCILTLKEQAITEERAALIKRYILFDEQMEIIEKHWPYIWIEMNKFMITDLEKERRANMLAVYNDFNYLVEDSFLMPTEDLSSVFYDDNNLQKLHSHQDKNLIWLNYLYLLGKKWDINFYKPPNTIVCDDKCIKCNDYLGYHMDRCQCVTCLIAGSPMPPKNYVKGYCDICVVRSKGEKEIGLYESKILNICANDDHVHKSTISSASASGTGTTNVLNKTSIAKRKLATLRAIEKDITGDNRVNEQGDYHIAWAVFKHLTDRKEYKHTNIDEQYFCKKCELTSCLIARKILNNMMEPTITMHLLHYYQPLDISVAELCVIVPNLRLFNRNVVAFNIISILHESTVKVFWIFVISLFAEHFMDLKEQPFGKDQLSNLLLVDGDISVNLEKIVGNRADRKFTEFLEFIRGHPSAGHFENDFLLQQVKNERRTVVESDHNYYKTDTLQQQYNQRHHEQSLANKHQCQGSQPQLQHQHQALHQQLQAAQRPESTENTNITTAAAQTSLTASVAVDTQPKKSTKPKKCCYDHPELAEHCKDAHCGKKRIKKECAHARINETRDRLRKKLSQMANARKNQETVVNTASSTDPSLHPIATSSAVAAAAAKTPADEIVVAASTSTTAPTPPLPPVASAKIDNAQLQQPSPLNIIEDIKQPSTLKKAATAAFAAISKTHTDTSAIVTESKTTNLPQKNLTTVQKQTTISGSLSEEAISALTDSTNEESQPYQENIAELMQNVLESFGKLKTNHKKWIDEKLNFIEGTDSGGKKQQPQSNNAKKAAKKAKQKQRKEEEKRITELHDLRGQYHDFYFKEFVTKHKLKMLKMNKKRDKKQIGELESNVKSLQRSKAKVEILILEHIGDLKQTNNEFKFSYLPTKEQQLEKMQELEEAELSSKSKSTVVKGQDQADKLQTATNNLNASEENNYKVPFTQANFPPPSPPTSFSYPIDFQSQGSIAYGMIRPHTTPPVCSTTPQCHPQVMTSMPSNADPSKRIVTIRRVNLPNVAEPQVTVTAKGTSPDKDKLLYTFVNGQIMASNNSSAVNTTNSNLKVYDLRSTDGFNQLQNEETNLKSSTNNEPVSKKKKKKDKKSKMLPQVQPKVLLNKSTNTHHTTRTSGSSSTPSSITPSCSETHTRENSVSSLQTKRKPTETKKNEKQRASEDKKPDQQKQQPVEQLIINTQKEQHQQTKPCVAESKDKKNKKVKKEQQTASSKILKQPQSTESFKSQSVQTEKLEKPKREKVIDNGQFDNNPYKTLHLHDSDSEVDLSTRPTSPESDQEDIKIQTQVMNNGNYEVSAQSHTKSSKITKKNQGKQMPNNEIFIEQHVRQQQNAQNVQNTTNKKSKKETKSIDSVKVIPIAITPTKTNNTNKKSTTIKAQTKSRNLETQMSTDMLQKRNKIATDTNPKQQYQVTQSNTKIKKSSNGHVSESSSSSITYDKMRKKTAHHQLQTNLSNIETRNSLRFKVDTLETAPAENRESLAKHPQKQIKRKQQKQPAQHHDTYNNYGYESAGIPNNMGYFNPKDVCMRGNIRECQQYQQQQYNADSLAKDMQTMQIGQQQSKSYADTVNDHHYYQSNYSKSNISANISIMDQLNRGVQVENLSLPPGITLTKVDPAKSEQLRQKSESIKKLAKPLQQQQQPTSQVYHQHPSGATIIAPPIVNSLSSYYGSPTTVPYTAIAAAPAKLERQSGIIMVEANPSPAIQTISQESKTNTSNSKTSKNKKRRSKAKPQTQEKELRMNAVSNTQQPKMITLRNPMFHTPEATSILQKTPIQTARPVSSMPVAPALTMDQPAAIIKNENGMYTIRNPALHQAVTNGLAASGYRQLGNVNYYTPQEAAAEAAKANKESAATKAKITKFDGNSKNHISKITVPTTPFSYFSNTTPATAQNNTNDDAVDKLNAPSNTLNNISITCTSVNRNSGIYSLDTDTSGIDLNTETNIITPKYLSAIGSEIKTAQQKRQKSQDAQWSNFGIDLAENRASCSSIFHGGNVTANTGVNSEFTNVTTLQEQYQKSTYYNGFDVFQPTPASSTNNSNHLTAIPTSAILNTNNHSNNNGSLFDAVDCHMHHSCGDESPPPSVTGYNSYLEGIPNTGVIRYDDASFLKSLIPGQHLNNEVSIHNINDSNFSRNASSPIPHRVDVTPIYAVPSPTGNLQTPATFRDTLTDYANEPQIFSHTNLENYSPYGYDFETSGLTKSQNAGIGGDFNDVTHAATVGGISLEKFVQNMNALKITVANEEQGSSNINGTSGNSNVGNSSNPSNGWW